MLHHLAHFTLGLSVALAAFLGFAAWRLSQGPVDLSWLTARLEAQANATGGPLRLSIGSTALAWEGFRLGVDRPIDLRLTDVRLTGRHGVRYLDLPRAEVSLSLLALLTGRVQPRAVELDGARLTLRRAADGAITLDLGSPTAQTPAVGTGAPTADPLQSILSALARPPASDRRDTPGWLAQMRRLRIHGGTLSMVDAGLGVTWHASRADVELNRETPGGVDGSFDGELAVGDSETELTGTVALLAAATETEVTARLTPIRPAALAKQMPKLAWLAALDAAVGAQAALRLGPALQVRQMHVTLRASPGVLRIGAGAVPMLGATVVLSGAPDDAVLDSARIALRGSGISPITTLTANGTLRRADGRFSAAFSLGLDHVAFADLPTLWPAGVGVGARAWVTENITSGIAHDGHVDVALGGRDDFSGVTLTGASGTLEGSDLNVSWLRPVPPLTHGEAQLRIIDPDTLLIDVRSAQEPSDSGEAGVAVTGGSMRITGLTQPDQVGTIDARVSGPLAAVITLLSEPRLHLLHDHPIGLQAPSGDAAVSLAVSLPLDEHVTMDQVAIHAAAHLTDAHLGGVVAGRDLSDGNLQLKASNDGLSINGKARLANIPAAIDAAMDFRAGPPSEAVQRVTVDGRATAAQLAAAGLDATDVMSGPIDLHAVLTERRDGSGDLQMNGDLTNAVLHVSPLAWRKPAGVRVLATATLRLLHDRLSAIDPIMLQGEGVALRGSADCTDGRVSLLRLDRLVLGRSDMSGTVRLPGVSGTAPFVIDISGEQIDLSARLAEHGEPAPKPHVEPPPGPPWILQARFNRALMAHSYLIVPLTLEATNDGSVFSRLLLAGRTSDKGAFRLQIGTDRGVRRLTATAANAGELLRALDILDAMQGGTLSISGTYDDTHPGHALTGTVQIDGFRVQKAAVLGRLLQAMTLYGLVDVLRGPGLAFAKLVAPFRLTDGTLELTDARAFSPSLGLTAKGQIDMDDGQADIRGTIVPAYFFNSLLGDVPIVGRLFSPERGGGVFAASYAVHGKLDDPSVSVNPLTALTPGFLRGMFGLF